MIKAQPQGAQKRPLILSVIVPVYNESEGLAYTHKRLTQVLDAIPERCEIIYIDDGSKDNSWELVQSLPSSSSDHVGITLSRNFGKEAAMSAGLQQSRGEAVILIDADLQDPPELIPQMLEAWRGGVDVVNMKRRERLGESWFKRFTAGSFYKVMNWASDVPIPENVGDFRLMSRQVVDHINQLPETNRYMKGLFAWPGFKQTTLEFDRDPRAVGETKWNYGKLFSFAMDGISSFSIRPLRLATWCGLVTAFSAFAYGAWVVAKTLIFGEAVSGYPSMMVVQLLLGGIQLLALGLIGEYLGRVVMEVKQRPQYLVREVSHQDGVSSVVSLEARRS
ncbi:glycosyltransferase family 2 protein [Ferrimonas aestuarii]|uniref:Glycosyltransferase family 2 protein n=1 Tax=Ferrimonas aestuarii TaxID=2569539 RepID=A0A4U1BKM9_9GAMM|nr:glycosyltransferase family 2 protein [Ferrimonas aestuarii]TKB52033.1 glycosyltransferase family 2 protein [Ferrimonas aestuarii]